MKCPFCKKAIEKINELIDKNEKEKERLLPMAITRNDAFVVSCRIDICNNSLKEIKSILLGENNGK